MESTTALIGDAPDHTGDETRRSVMGGPRVPILMYHDVAPLAPTGLEKYVVHPGAFARQMRWLRLRGYTAVDLDLVLDGWAGRRRLPRRPVVITFDDGFRTLLDHAVPVLKDLGFTATFFLVAGLTGRSSIWLRDALSADLPLMSWDDARALEARGFHCQCHTMSHPHLTALTEAACREELAASRARLAEELGHPAHHLAYPFGDYDDHVRRVADEEGFRSACSVHRGRASAADDHLALRRIPIDGSDTLLDFANRLRNGDTVRESMRGRYVQVRRRVAPGAMVDPS